MAKSMLEAHEEFARHRLGPPADAVSSTRGVSSTATTLRRGPTAAPMEAVGGSLDALLLALAEAGAELAPHPHRNDRIRFRPRELACELVRWIGASREELLRLLGDADACFVGEARAILDERLGIALDLGIPTHPGSRGWLIAVAEALACARRADDESLVSPRRDGA